VAAIIGNKTEKLGKKEKAPECALSILRKQAQRCAPRSNRSMRHVWKNCSGRALGIT
jgi:hypothetical protein